MKKGRTRSTVDQNSRTGGHSFIAKKTPAHLLACCSAWLMCRTGAGFTFWLPIVPALRTGRNGSFSARPFPFSSEIPHEKEVGDFFPHAFCV